jgi:hypothetical protein
MMAPPTLNSPSYPSQSSPAQAPGALQYGGGQVPYPPSAAGMVPPPQQYVPRNAAVEVEGAGRSKSQLIVGIDFVSLRRGKDRGLTA